MALPAGNTTSHRGTSVSMRLYMRTIANCFLLTLATSLGCAGDALTSTIADQCQVVAPKTASIDSATAAGRWNALTRAIVSRREMGPLGIARTFGLVSVGQYNAAVAASAATQTGAAQSEAGAAAGAAATILAGVYPLEQTAIDAQLAADAVRVSAVASGCGAQFTAGVAAGRVVGAAVLARAAADGSNAVWTGTVPAGPGMWVAAPPPAQPLSPSWGLARPWLMTSGNQFRPAAPPAFGSAAFVSALTEVRQFSDTRTAEQLRIAQVWGAVVATSGPSGYWSQQGLSLAVAAQLDEMDTARMLAMLHMAGMDASIGCWDAKYAFWYIRPYQSDVAITTPVGRPNFPSYPSAHSCLSAAYGGVLAGLFPSATSTLQAQVDEAGVSRIYAGLHYRFDVTAGQDLGSAVAKLALAKAPVRDVAISLQ
ncbi:MAG: vanadium-dependent haloperoxidase [bacterium]